MEENAKEKMKKLKIITINIRGALAQKLLKNKQFCEVINKNDVILLQETRYGTSSAEDQESVVIFTNDHFNLFDLKLNEDVKGYFTIFSSNERGVGIIINTKHQFITHFNHKGDYIGVSANIKGFEYIFVSFYFHKNENEDLLNQFNNDIKEKHGIHVIGGDFNVTMNPTSDMNLLKRYYSHKKRRETIKKVWPYTDVWRIKHPDSKEFTRTNTRDGVVTQQTRLDYFFMMKKDIQLATECEILSDELPTDHKAVQLSLVFPSGSSAGDVGGGAPGGARGALGGAHDDARDGDEVDEDGYDADDDDDYKNDDDADDGDDSDDPDEILMSIQASAQKLYKMQSMVFNRMAHKYH